MKLAVAHVAKNRLETRWWGNTYSEVIWAPNQFAPISDEVYMDILRYGMAWQTDAQGRRIGRIAVTEVWAQAFEIGQAFAKGQLDPVLHRNPMEQNPGAIAFTNVENTSQRECYEHILDTSVNGRPGSSLYGGLLVGPENHGFLRGRGPDEDRGLIYYGPAEGQYFPGFAIAPCQ